MTTRYVKNKDDDVAKRAALHFCFQKEGVLKLSRASPSYLNSKTAVPVHKIFAHYSKQKRWRDRFNLALVNQQSLFSPAGLSSDLYPPRSIEGKSRTKLCQKRPQVPGLGHLQSYARFKGGKTKQGYQRMVGLCRLMVMADGDG